MGSLGRAFARSVRAPDVLDLGSPVLHDVRRSDLVATPCVEPLLARFGLKANANNILIGLKLRLIRLLQERQLGDDATTRDGEDALEHARARCASYGLDEFG